MIKEVKDQLRYLEPKYSSYIPLSFRLISIVNNTKKTHTRIISGTFYRSKYMMAYPFEKPISKICYIKEN